MTAWLDVETWTIDGLVLGSTVDGVAYVVDEVTGWSDSAPPRPRRTPRPAAHGSYRSPVWRGDKIVTLAGWAEVASEEQAYMVEQLLAALCDDPHTLYPLRHTDSKSGEDRVLNVELDGPVLVRIAYEQRPLTVRYSLQVAAADPRKYSATTKSASTALASPPADGVRWDGTAGVSGTEWDGPAGSTGTVWEGAVGVPGTVQVTNEGTAPTPVLLTISGGSVTNPLVRNMSTGEVVAYGGTLASADVLRIDTGTGEVTLNGVNRRPQLTRADFFAIAPGATLLSFEGTAVSGAPLLTVQWADAYH